MKSIKQWMFEKGMISEEVDQNSMVRYFGSSQIDIDQNLKRELRPKIERIIDMDEYSSMPREELLQKIKTIVTQVVADVGGTKFNSRALAQKLGDEGSEVNKSRFAQMMGSERLEVDSKLRSELKPKLEFIMDMEEYKSIPKAELEEKLIAVVSQLVAELTGSTMSLSSFSRKMNSFEEDPVAKEESYKFPSFLRWVENDEEGQGSVSEPQHEEGEDNMELKDLVEKRMMQMSMELESDGKGSRQEILAAMKAVVDSANKESEDAAGQNQPEGGEQAPPEGAQPEGQAPAPQQPQA